MKEHGTMTQQSENAIRGTGWQADHARKYIETNGKEGHIWRGVPTLLLTTTGTRSGEPYTTPLIYGEDNGRYLIVASYGGAAKHPQWYRNLVAQPEVGLQVGADRFQARARSANAEEKPALWQKMADIFPSYNDYQAKTERDIPVIILERI
jgi:deazaflavin-dependent oxidoreductase (nitroreductase family)